MRPDGSCHTGVVQATIAGLVGLGYASTHIIVRSTVPPGFCSSLATCFMPEFLTEANSEADFRACRWVLGLPRHVDASETQAVVKQLFRSVAWAGVVEHSQVKVTDCCTAELLKYFRNAFLATKVALCNEVASLAEALQVDYGELRGLFTLDPRVGTSHCSVPGPDGRKGYGGTCFPKDAHALRNLAGRIGVPCPVLDAVITRNEAIDRPDKDWEADVGRAIL
eukprot:jgi/Chrzof1/9271/UNPLg00238.t1